MMGGHRWTDATEKEEKNSWDRKNTTELHWVTESTLQIGRDNSDRERVTKVGITTKS